MNNTQPSKPDPKRKAIASFVLGIVNFLFLCLIGLLTLVIHVSTSNKWGWNILETIWALVIYGAWVFLLPLILLGFGGLILGKLGIKSSMKGFAVVGIVLSIIALLFVFFVIILFFLAGNDKFFPTVS